MTRGREERREVLVVGGIKGLERWRAGGASRGLALLPHHERHQRQHQGKNVDQRAMQQMKPPKMHDKFFRLALGSCANKEDYTQHCVIHRFRTRSRNTGWNIKHHSMPDALKSFKLSYFPELNIDELREKYLSSL